MTRVREKKRLKEKMKKREMTKILWKHKSQYQLERILFPIQNIQKHRSSKRTQHHKQNKKSNFFKGLDLVC